MIPARAQNPVREKNLARARVQRLVSATRAARPVRRRPRRARRRLEFGIATGCFKFRRPELSESSRRGQALRRGLAARARLCPGRDCPNRRPRVPGTEREVDPAPKDSDQLELESDLPRPLRTRMLPRRRPACGRRGLHCTPGTRPTLWALCGLRCRAACERGRRSEGSACPDRDVTALPSNRPT